MSDCKRILLVHTAFLGDVVLATSFVEAVKLTFPQSNIDMLVTPAYQEVLGNNPFLNKVLTFDKKNGKAKAFCRMIKEIRKESYDLAFLLHSSFTSSLLTFFGRIRRRVGFKRNFSQLFLTDRVEFRQDCHRIEKNFALLSVFGVLQEIPKTKVYPEKMPAVFDNGQKMVAVAPGSVWATKRLPKWKFKEILDELPTVNLLFVGSADERQMCKELIQSLQNPQNALNFAGKCNILQTAECLRQADLVLCNDSGILHLAEAVGSRVFAFFGPTVRDLGYYPYIAQDKMFEVDLDCRPCGKHGHKSCPLGHHNCMTKMDTTEVVAEINKYF